MAVKQVTFGREKDNGHTYNFYFNKFFFRDAFKYDDCAKF
jgi:hypothetical protein